MAMSDYTPSFYDTGASRREQERRGSYGGGGYGRPDVAYGGLGNYRAPGAYVSTNAYDYGGDYNTNPGAGNVMPGPYKSNFQKPHANMMSTDREQIMRMQAQQLQADRHRQMEEKRIREIQRKERERLEDQQLEDNIRKQQEKMRQEFEDEVNRKKKKEAEQKRRREAQLAHLEAMQLRAEEDKKKRLVGAHRREASNERDQYSSLSRGRSTSVPEPDNRISSRFGSARDEDGFGARRTSVGGRSRRGRERPDDQRPLRPDADFGLNLGQAAHSTHLSTTFPNRFFDSNYSKKLADRNKEKLARRQSKPTTASEDAQVGSGAPHKLQPIPEVCSEPIADPNKASEIKTEGTKTEEAKFEPPKTPEKETEADVSKSEKMQEDEPSQSEETQVERPKTSEARTETPKPVSEDNDGKVQQEFSAGERPATSEAQAETPKSASKGQEKNVQQESSGVQVEDCEAQDLKESGEQADFSKDASTSTFFDDIPLDWDRENTEKVATPPPPPAPHFDWKIKVDNISEEEKNKLNQMSEEEIRNFQDNNTDVMSQLSAMKRDLRTGAGRDSRPTSPELKNENSIGFRDTIPAGPGDSDVDYFKVPTAPSSPDNTRRADRANNRRRAQASSLDLDGTSGTVLRKYLEHTKAAI